MQRERDTERDWKRRKKNGKMKAILLDSCTYWHRIGLKKLLRPSVIKCSPLISQGRPIYATRSLLVTRVVKQVFVRLKCWNIHPGTQITEGNYIKDHELCKLWKVYISIYIYINMCVCVCVCVCLIIRTFNHGAENVNI